MISSFHAHIDTNPHIILDKIDRTIHNLNVFENYVKLSLLQPYQDTCSVPTCYYVTCRVIVLFLLVLKHNSKSRSLFDVYNNREHAVYKL